MRLTLMGQRRRPAGKYRGLTPGANNLIEAISTITQRLDAAQKKLTPFLIRFLSCLNFAGCEMASRELQVLALLFQCL